MEAKGEEGGKEVIHKENREGRVCLIDFRLWKCYFYYYCIVSHIPYSP